jgi:hypothetical protein
MLPDIVVTAAPCRGNKPDREKMVDLASQETSKRLVDEIDRARAQEYALLASLLSRSPDSRLISALSRLQDDASPLGRAHMSLAEAAARASEESVAREYSSAAVFVPLSGGRTLRTPVGAIAPIAPAPRDRKVAGTFGTGGSCRNSL